MIKERVISSLAIIFAIIFFNATCLVLLNINKQGEVSANADSSYSSESDDESLFKNIDNAYIHDNLYLLNNKQSSSKEEILSSKASSSKASKSAVADKSQNSSKPLLSKPKPNNNGGALNSSTISVPPKSSSSSSSNVSSGSLTSSNNSNSSSNSPSSSDNKSSSSEEEEKFDPNALTVKNSYTNKIVKDNNIIIVASVVANEMGPSFSDEALKAQAVAAHTYMKSLLNKGITPVVALRTPNDRIIKLVTEVIDEFVYYNNSMATSIVYHANSGGKTQAGHEYWNTNIPYLVAVTSKYDAADNKPFEIDIDEALKVLEKNLSCKLSDDPNEWFEIKSYTSGDFVAKIRVGNKVISGREFREKAFNTPLRSNKITDIKIDEKNNKIIIQSKGYGHGVGLSQVGANGYALNENYTYKKILKHYFPGTEIK